MIDSNFSARLDNIESLIRKTDEKLNKIDPVYTGNMQHVPFNKEGMKENSVIQRLEYCLPISTYTFKILKTIEEEELVASVNFVGSSNVRIIADKINKIVSKCKNLNVKHMCIIRGLAMKIEALWAQTESDIAKRNWITRITVRDI
jgi:hypothetical protein